VLLTKKIKEHSDGKKTTHEAGSSKLDEAYNAFIEKGESQFKLITMPTVQKIRAGSTEEKGPNEDLLLADTYKADQLIKDEPTVSNEYYTQPLSPLYADHNMLLKPKKRKEYRFSKAIDVVPESLSPMQAMSPMESKTNAS